MSLRSDQAKRRRRRKPINSLPYLLSVLILLLPLSTSSSFASDTDPRLESKQKPSRWKAWAEAYLITHREETLNLSLPPNQTDPIASDQVPLHPPPHIPSPPPATPVSPTFDHPARPLQTAPPSAYAPYYGPGYETKPHPVAPAYPQATPPALVHQPGPFHALGKRWAGYTTLTVFVNTVTVYAGQNNGLQVVTVTVNDSPGEQAGGTVFVTVGGATQTVGGGAVLLGPQTTSTQTVYITPTPVAAGPMTIHSTITVGAIATGSPQVGSPSAYLGADDRPCLPGEDGQRYPGKLAPTNPTQTSTLFAIGVYFVFILVSWNLFVVRQLIYPIKLLVVAWHEFGHVVACACSGARLESVTIDPNEGGATRMMAQVYPAAGLPAGYLSSFLFGGVMIFCGFNTLASKVASFIIVMSLVVVFWWASGMMTRVLTLGAVGLVIGFWFIDHAGILRYFVLFAGVMSAWYVIFDVMDDFVFRKLNPCCPVMFEERFPQVKAGVWALIWIGLATLNFIGWILLSLTVWRETPRGMYCQSQQFLPT